MEIIVQKFGGTSVGKQEVREEAVRKIIRAYDSGKAPIVVVSAMGRKGDPYATDTLLSIVKQYSAYISSRDKDLLMSCGEVLSAVLISAMLNAEGYKAQALTGFQAGLITDGRHGNADCRYVYTKYISDLLEKNIIPVVAGFQGVSENNEITTLGRGGSDTTAALLANAHKAVSLEIYTDVDGVMTADPRIVEQAVIIRNIPYDEMYHMADHGAKIIHNKAVDIAAASDTEIRILNILSDDEGTNISGLVPIHDPENSDDVVNSVVLMKNRTQVTVSRLGTAQELNILKKLADNSISIDLINIFPDKIVFTIDGLDKQKAGELISEMKLEHEFIDDCCKVSAVGSRMRGVPGVMARIFGSLKDAGCEILQSADSHMNISCLVKQKDSIRAVKALHEEFNL